MNCVIAILLGAAGLGRAERLAIKAYTAADGLAHNHINRIRQDAVGFLWFCTDEGLSRFDGYRFTNYTTEHGLPHPWVNDFLQSRDGAYWIATDGGVCRFNPAGPQRFVVYRPGSTLDARRVNALIEDREGIIWCGTYQGLYRLERTASQVRFQSVDIGAPAQYEGALVNNLMLDRRETLWAAARSGLYRRRTDGPWERYTTFHGLPDLFIEALAEDRAGRLWAGTRTAGFCELLSDPELERRIVRMCYSTEEGLPANDVRSIVQTSDGRMWIGGSAGLTELIPSGDGGRGQLRSYTTAHGLSDSVIYRLAEDRDGNLWIGTKHAGVMRMARQAFVTYGESEGFRPCDDISSIFETLSGDLVVSGGDSSHRLIQRFDGRSFIATDLNVSRLPANLSWAWRQPAIQDRAGEWWVATEAGLVRFPRVRRLEDLARVRPKAVYTVRDGFAEDGVRRLYLDAKGDVWIPSENGVAHALARWERATGTFRRFTGDSLPVLKSKLASAFGEDGSGRLWIGFADNGGVVRCPGREESGCLPVAGAPKGSIHALFVDHANRVWAASSEGGLARLDDPSTDQPRFVSYTAAMGLSSNEVWCLTEDRWGRIYAGTSHGVDRLDPASGRIKRFTSADGVAKGTIQAAYRDRRGTLWFASDQGVSRLDAEGVPAPPPPVRISALRIAGVAYRLSDLGEASIGKLDLPPAFNHLQIEFVGVAFSSGETLRYQYILQGADRDWSAPTEQRNVNYASLAPGAYRFRVQAVNADGIASPEAATVMFAILPPVWRRWWFEALAGGAVFMLAYGIHRYRIARLRELDGVRMRMAADLHDDIGSSLAQIAILSEVASRADDSAPRQSLGKIASISRETLHSINDIIWCVDPQQDKLSELIHRMRRFGGDLFAHGPASFTFHTSGIGRDLDVSVDCRRQVFLIYKEALNNAVRHSGASQVSVSVDVDRGVVRLCVTDNGHGFDTTRNYEGKGLNNMIRRARDMNGSLEVHSGDGGTMIVLRAPVVGRHSPPLEDYHRHAQGSGPAG